MCVLGQCSKCYVWIATEPFCAVCDYWESGTFRNEKQTGTLKFLNWILARFKYIFYYFTMPIFKFFYKIHCMMWILFSACLRCKLVLIVGTLNEDNMCAGCQRKNRCLKCCCFLPPHLFCDRDGIGAMRAFEGHLRQAERQSTGRLKTCWRNTFSTIVMIR